MYNRLNISENSEYSESRIVRKSEIQIVRLSGSLSFPSVLEN